MSAEPDVSAVPRVTARTTYRVAVDVGGTFVDAVALDERTGAVTVAKARTTPRDPAAGVLAALDGLGVPLAAVTRLTHGTTLGLNAVLQRRGARCGLITTAGFEDVLHIGRGDVPFREMYNLSYVRPEPLVPRRRIHGVAGRLDHTGAEVEPLDEAAVAQAARRLVEEHHVGSIALCFLHSYAEPAHELRAEQIIRALYPDVSVSVSAKVARMYREYERTSSTVMAAYIAPILDSYLSLLERELRARDFTGAFWIMRSGGGAMTAQSVRDEPLTTVFSGPAGGIAGTVHLSQALGRDQMLSFDVGGTSLDTCVIDGGTAATAYEARLTDLPIMTPVFDLRTIGAGGGSVAWLDDGLLRVGPQSAGAEPGPACYDTGGVDPTVTDAAVALGYLSPEEFVVGGMTLSADAADRAIGSVVAEPLGLDVTAGAAGIFKMVAVRTVDAIHELTVERGTDPRDFSLVAFGGAGPLLASLVMQETELAEVVVPVAPGAYSAWGMLMADLELDLARSAVQPLSDDALRATEPAFAEMIAEAGALLGAQDVAEADRAVERRVELRYRFQEHALSVPVYPGVRGAQVRELFDAVHEETFGHRLPNDIEIVTLRVHAVGAGSKPELGEAAVATAVCEPVGHREAYDYVTAAMRRFAVFRRGRLGAGAVVPGPAIVLDETCNIIVPSDSVARVDRFGNVVINLRRGSEDEAVA